MSLRPWVTPTLLSQTIGDLRFIEQVAHDYRLSLESGKPVSFGLQDLENAVQGMMQRIDAARARTKET
jgi:hypothetical protein